eukprot:sb/3477769/
MLALTQPFHPDLNRGCLEGINMYPAAIFCIGGTTVTCSNRRQANDPVYDDIDEFEAQFMASQPEYANTMAEDDDVYANNDLRDAPDARPNPAIPPRPKPRIDFVV